MKSINFSVDGDEIFGRNWNLTVKLWKVLSLQNVWHKIEFNDGLNE